MVEFFKIVAVTAGILFPLFLINAIKAQGDEKTAKYTGLSCLCFGVIVFVLMGLR